MSNSICVERMDAPQPRAEQRHTMEQEQDLLWYKDAIIYNLNIKSFFDFNNDGSGDIQGLIEKLDYLEDLGVNCLSLMPFYDSPFKDDGYDIADYRKITCQNA